MAESESGTGEGAVVVAKVICTVIALVLAAAFALYAIVTIGLKSHLKEHCGKNLGQIWVRCWGHAERHDGKFPAKWSELSWDDMGGITNTTWDRLFACPTVGHGPGKWEQVDLWSSYHLIPGRTTNDPSGTVLAVELLADHKEGANVLFVDGYTQWWSTAKVLGLAGAPTNALFVR